MVQIKKVFVFSSLLMSFAVTAAHSVGPTMALFQRDSCIVDGVPMSDVDVRNGQTKIASCVWQSGDPGLQITVLAGQQFSRVDASCKFTPAMNSKDIISDIKADKGATISSISSFSNPIRFTMINNYFDPNMNIQFFLNEKQDYKTKISRFFSRSEVEYTPGDVVTCTFKPMAG